MVHLIGGYKDALKLRQGEKITFHEEAFLASRPPHMTPFLQVNNLEKVSFAHYFIKKIDKFFYSAVLYSM